MFYENDCKIQGIKIIPQSSDGDFCRTLLGNPQHTLQMVIAVLFNRICNFYRIQFYCANVKNIDIASQN